MSNRLLTVVAHPADEAFGTGDDKAFSAGTDQLAEE